MAEKDSSVHRSVYADYVVFQRHEIIAESDIERARESMEHDHRADIDVIDSSGEGQILVRFVYKQLSPVSGR